LVTPILKWIQIPLFDPLTIAILAAKTIANMILPGSCQQKTDLWVLGSKVYPPSAPPEAGKPLNPIALEYFKNALRFDGMLKSGAFMIESIFTRAAPTAAVHLK